MNEEEKTAPWARAYFNWLVPQVQEHGHQRHTYEDVLMLLHTKEFVWFVPNDHNRLEDGAQLRLEFLHEADAPDFVTLDFPVSVLEVLVALSRRLEFQAEGTPEGWAWQLMVNLGLDKMTDPLSTRKARKVDDILETLIWRTYDADGTGGFFPLAWPQDDQTKIEVWYQMHSYVIENTPHD